MNKILTLLIYKEMKKHEVLHVLLFFICTCHVCYISSTFCVSLKFSLNVFNVNKYLYIIAIMSDSEGSNYSGSGSDVASVASNRSRRSGASNRSAKSRSISRSRSRSGSRSPSRSPSRSRSRSRSRYVLISLLWISILSND